MLAQPLPITAHHLKLQELVPNSAAGLKCPVQAAHQSHQGLQTQVKRHRHGTGGKAISLAGRANQVHHLKTAFGSVRIRQSLHGGRVHCAGKWLVEPNMTPRKLIVTPQCALAGVCRRYA